MESDSIHSDEGITSEGDVSEVASSEEEEQTLRVPYARRVVRFVPEISDSGAGSSSPEIELDGKQEIFIEQGNSVESLSAQVKMLHVQLKSLIEEQTNFRKENQKSTKREVFKVPREHPMFSGEPTELETFLMEMEIQHENYTSRKSASKHHPEFILKLLPYFKRGSAANIWFKMYASERRKKRLTLSWEKLVRDLRNSYGTYDQAQNSFEKFYELSQTADVQTYIAQKSEAALLAEDLTPKIELYGFLRGLKENVKNYVNLQMPSGVKEAHDYAVAYENSLGAGNGKKSARKRTSDEAECTQALKKSKTRDHKESGVKQGVLKELRLLRSGKCFLCGVPGHIREKCTASEEIKSKFQAKIRELKGKLNNH